MFLSFTITKHNIVVHFDEKSTKDILIIIQSLYGLQVNGGVFDRDFTKSLIIRDFDDVLKNSFRYVVLFSLHKLL